MSEVKKYSIGNGKKVKRNSTSSHCRINQKKSDKNKFNNAKNQQS